MPVVAGILAGALCIAAVARVCGPDRAPAPLGSVRAGPTPGLAPRTALRSPVPTRAPLAPSANPSPDSREGPRSPLLPSFEDVGITYIVGVECEVPLGDGLVSVEYDTSELDEPSDDLLDVIARIGASASVTDGVATFVGVLTVDSAWLRRPAVGSVPVTWASGPGPDGRGRLATCHAGPLVGERSVRGRTRAPAPHETLRVWLCGTYLDVAPDGTFEGWAPEGRPCMAWVERSAGSDLARGPIVEVTAGAAMGVLGLQCP